MRLLWRVKPINPCDEISFRKAPFSTKPPKLRWSFGTMNDPAWGGGAPSTSSFRKCVEAILNLGFLGALGTMIVHTLLVPLQGLAFLCHNISMKCWVSNGDQVGILGENKAVESGKKAMSCLQMQWRNPLEIVDMFFVVHGSGSTIYSLQVHNAWDCHFENLFPNWHQYHKSYTKIDNQHSLIQKHALLWYFLLPILDDVCFLSSIYSWHKKKLHIP